MNDRHDIVISGLVTAEQPIEAVSLVLQGEVKAFALYPWGVDGTQQVFRLGLAQRRDLYKDTTTFEIVARTRDSYEDRAAFTIAADPNDPRIVQITAGPVSDAQLTVERSAPVLLYVETAAVDSDGVLHLVGWAVARTQILAVQVFIDDQRIGSAQLGQIRDDIAAAYPTYPNARPSGFMLSSRLPDDNVPEHVAVEAIDLSGSVNRIVVPIDRLAALPTAPELEVKSAAIQNAAIAPDPRRAITVHCDIATLSTNGELIVSGWAVCATGIAAITVNLDGEMVGEAQLGLPRSDVAEEYPGIPQAHHSGFHLQKRLAAPAAGEHRLHVLVRNGLDDMRNLPVPVELTEAEAAAPQPVHTDLEEFRFQLDGPTVLNGVVPDPVIGRLVIEGWALARGGVQEIEILLDGRSLGQAYYGTARRDVEAAFPDWVDALRCGYIFHCPPRELEAGNHLVQVRLKGKSGRVFETEFRIDVQQSQDAEDYATIRRRLSRAEIDLYQDIISRLGRHVSLRLLMPVRARTASEAFATSLRALAAQVYDDWRLVVVVDKAIAGSLRQIAVELGLTDRLSFVLPSAGQPALLPAAVKGHATMTGLLLPGDELGVDALAEIAIAHLQHPGAQIVYADEDRVSPALQMREPFFKPDWSPDLLLSTNYIGRPWFVSGDMLAKAGLTPAILAAPGGDYDAVLRCTEQTAQIHHLPKLLCRRSETEAAEPAAERRVLAAAAARRGIKADLLPGCIPGTWRLKRTTPAKGKVSIIIPTCAAQGHVKKCLATLRAKTAYRDFEVICIDNIPADMPEWKTIVRDGSDKVVDIPESFNWSRFNNRAAEQADGEYLLFLNDDIEIEREDWLDALLEHAQRPEVGIVGAQLLYPDRKVQHAGIFLTTLGAGRHSFRFLAEDDPGYFGLALTQRNSIAVTGACMLMRREVFDKIGRFDEAHEVVNNDVDCCLRAGRAGYAVVYQPYAQLIHHELASRAKLKDIFDSGHFARQWRTLYATGDPFFSPRLTKFADEFRPDTEPARLICAARPLFRMEEMQRILVAKLDHIGDLITAIPALRRLRRHFPKARIHLLASGAAKAFLAGENCVDEFIEFEFFHARSGLGQKELTEDDLRALGKRLEPYRFDLAMDMRKQLETRHVLKFIPARFRAGFNHQGRFPWLDIALEWEGDNQLRRKQSHVSDDLLRLVETVATAGDIDRAVLPMALSRPPPLPNSLSPEARALFRRPVVAVHPGVGAIMRQWMPEYFASVIDLLIEKDHVNVVVIGGRDEAELAEQVVEGVVNQNHVLSLAGKTSLAELTAVLRNCALYLGNNSGPKHIAAALGVPTVGIHSGIVDATEWGPVGPRAIAVQKNMMCSPCYLVKPEDCVRDMACLKRLEPGVVHAYCQMILARVVPVEAVAERPKRLAVVGRSGRAAAPAAPVGKSKQLAGKHRGRA